MGNSLPEKADLLHMRRSNLEHKNILDAIRRRDKEKALKLTRLHLEKVSRRHKEIAAQNT